MKTLWAFDTEDDSEGNVRLINFYDGREHITFRSRLAAMSWLYDQRDMTIWATNAEYDLINLFGWYLGRMVTLMYSHSLLSGVIPKQGIQFFDTLRHWPVSVAEMGELIGLPKLAPDFTSDLYCQRDTEIVWKFVHLMTDEYETFGIPMRKTLPSSALQLFKKWYAIPERPFFPELQEWFRTGYHGGRVEAYRLDALSGTIRHYDVNSLFPYVMQAYPFPDPVEYRVTDRLDLNREGMAEVTLKLPYHFFPALAVTTEDDLLFPYGTFSGTFTYPELRQALEDGAVILSVKQAVECPTVCNPFREFVHYCYAQRMAAKEAWRRLWWKLLLNSLYGKFGQHGELIIIKGDRQIELPSNSPSHVNVMWAAYVTAYARLELLRWLRAAPDVFYTDTDSLFTSATLPVSSDLGALKLEGVYQHAQFVGNKMYILDDEARAKGMPRKQYALDGTVTEPAKDFIRTGQCVYRKPARLRESMRGIGVTPNKWYEVDKKLDVRYTKRRTDSGMWLEPWEFSHYLNERGRYANQ